MAEVRRGTGPEALPFGAATQLNRAMPEDVAGTPVEPGADVPVVFAPGGEDEVSSGNAGISENMGVLLESPNPAYRASVIPQDRPGRVPRSVVRHMPALMAATRNPEAPPTLRALYNALTRQLEAEQRAGD